MTLSVTWRRQKHMHGRRVLGNQQGVEFAVLRVGLARERRCKHGCEVVKRVAGPRGRNPKNASPITACALNWSIGGSRSKPAAATEAGRLLSRPFWERSWVGETGRGAGALGASAAGWRASSERRETRKNKRETGNN